MEERYKVWVGNFPLTGEYSKAEADKKVANLENCVKDPIVLVRITPEPEYMLIQGGRKE